MPVEDGRFTTELDFLEILPPARCTWKSWFADPATLMSRCARQHILPAPLAGYALSGSLTGITSGVINQLPGPLVGITESNPIATLHVERENLFIDSSALAGDDAIIEAADAVLGLYSNAVGGFGSGVSLAEVTGGGTVTNKWLIIRETSTGGNGLRFVFGPGSNPGGAPPAFYLDDSNRVGVNTDCATCPAACGRRCAHRRESNFELTDARLHIPASAFTPADSTNVTVTELDGQGQFMLGLSVPPNSNGAAVASVPLPDGAVITDIVLTVSNAASQNTTLTLYREDYAFPNRRIDPDRDAAQRRWLQPAFLRSTTKSPRPRCRHSECGVHRETLLARRD